MKTKLCLTLLLSSVFYLLSSQVPQGFNYQAIARDNLGNPIVNTGLPVTITIKTDSTAGIIIWEELHSSVTTNGFGLFTLVVGNGSRLASSNVAYFKDIDWSVTPKFIKTQILHQSQLLDMGTTRFWSVPYSMAAGNLAGPVDKLNVKGKTNVMDEALFEVKNKDGQTVFAVYNEGVRVYVADGAKGNTKGGFAIGGFGTDKGISQNYLTVSRDSIRAYVNDTIAKGVTKGGFAIGGFGTAKGQGQEYLRVTPDSTRIYVDNSVAKGVTKGGFAIGGFGTAKEAKDEYLRVTSDSVKVSKSLLIPRLTTYERDHLSFTPGEALIIFNMSEGCMQIFKNNVWSNIWCFNCAPAFIIQPVDNIICSGNTVNFFISATGTSLNYKWQISTNGGSIWNDISNGGTTPAYSGANSYSLKLTNVPVGFNNYKFRCVVAGSCPPDITSNSVTLNVGSTPPVILMQPTNQVLSPGCAASFSVSSPGYSVSYKWQQSIDGGANWTNISNGGASPVFAGATTSTLSLTNVPWSYNNYKYRCVASNLCGADATSTSATLTIAPAAILTQPTNQSLTTGCTASFAITTPAGYTISYQWQVSTDAGSTWNNISNGGSSPVNSGVTAATLALSNVPLSHNNYKYRCVVSSLCGPNETSTAATLSIAASAILTQPVNQQLIDNCNTSFSITTSAGYAITYQWQTSSNAGSTWTSISNGGTSPLYSGASAATLSLSNIPFSFNNYQYRCVVNSICGPNETSTPATLSLNTSPAIIVQPVNKLVYSGSQVTFSIVTSGSWYPLQWQESTDGGSTWTDIVNGGTNPTYNVYPTAANKINLTISNIPVTNDNYKYRCFVNLLCRPGIISDEITLSVLPSNPVSDIEGNIYNTVGIGSQLWMAKNLKTTKYSNGDLIGTTVPANKDITGESNPKYQWAYNGIETNVSTYGRLYTWYAVTDSRNICPTGWHVPSNEEWTTMINYLGGFYLVGGKLKEAGTTHWNEPNTGATNESGFTALPGGGCESGFYNLGANGFWWTSSEFSTTRALKWDLNYDDENAGWYDNEKTLGLSVRCVKNY